MAGFIAILLMLGLIAWMVYDTLKPEIPDDTPSWLKRRK